MSQALPRRILAIGSTVGGGDWPPLAATVSALIARGHEVHYLGDAILAELARGSGLDVDVYPPEIDPVSRVKQWAEARKTDPSLPFPLAAWRADALPFALQRVAATRPELLLCTDVTCPLAIGLRNRTQIPVGLVHATYYLGDGARRTAAEDFAPKEQFVAAAFANHLRAADFSLIATDPLFDPPPELARENQHWVGPLIWEPRQPVPGYLDEPGGDPWTLVTLSSARQDGEGELARAALEALAAQPVRTLLTLADTSAQDALGPLPRNASVEPFVPHSPVLERAALCISHAGHGIVAKSLYYGVPMVLVPWDRDQPGVAARAEALGVARVVPRDQLSPTTLARAITEALGDGALRARCAAHGERIRRYDPSQRACDAILDFLANPNRASHAM